MKRKKTILTAAIFMVAVCLSAQNKSAGINLSLWKDICTQPHDSTQTTYVNIGLLSTMNRLNGVGINALGSVVHGDMNGVQITGLANLAGGTMRGVQFAGISNISGNNTIGLSAAGLVNITGDGSKGVVISGLTNIGGDNNSGVMLSGFMNVTGNMASGVQLSGAANITGQAFNGVMTSGLLNVVGEHMNGLQMAGLANITGNKLNGVQVGAFNYATNVRGLQIGLVNYYQKEMKGFQLGLVNANPDTRVQMMMYGGNATPANIGVRFKNNLFYTIVGVGSFYQDLNDKFSISASYRAGMSFSIYKGLSISGDLGYQHIEACSNKDEVIPRRLYALQARANVEYQLTKKFGIFATGGYGLTRFYNKSSNYDKGAIIEAGIVIF
ncbi:LA_2272 family surface repeat-containing protein [uncultured Bacteroides sp.]|uniref:LA_2272 family surface repeat-containing protein n=1 Tax=uncultured Bacteroides sp. TaxID=162156 RepID=UPI0025D917C5|nr:hypothetical protein [uncultured Bacteroides sp.]